MIFVIVSFVVPTAIFIFYPLLMKRLTVREAPRDALLVAACALFAISWYLPSPLIHGANTQFTTHFLGGGVFCGLMWLYTKRRLGWNPSWWIGAASLYALVSALGVANELFEWALFELHLTRLSGTDTWWDLVANTSGALLFFIIYTLFSSYDRTRMDGRTSR